MKKENEAGLKAQSFIMVIDRDRASVIQAMLSGYLQDDCREFAERLAKTIEHDGLKDEFMAFVEELGKKVHEKDWCDDPECSHKELYEK